MPSLQAISVEGLPMRYFGRSRYLTIIPCCGWLNWLWISRIYVAFALLTSFVMLMIFFNHPHELRAFTPGYAFLVSHFISFQSHIFPYRSHLSQIFPLMLSGVISASVLSVLDLNDTRSIGILLIGYFFQGVHTSSHSTTVFHILTGICRAWFFHDLLLHMHIHHSIDYGKLISFPCVLFLPFSDAGSRQAFLKGIKPIVPSSCVAHQVLPPWPS